MTVPGRERITLLGAKETVINPATLQKTGQSAVISRAWATVEERRGQASFRGEAIEFPVSYKFVTHYCTAYLSTRFIVWRDKTYRLIEAPNDLHKWAGRMEFRAVAGDGL